MDKPERPMNRRGLLILVLLGMPYSLQAEDLGNLSANPFDAESTANPFGKGSPFAPNGIHNPYSPYGSPYSNQSATNPFATDAPRLYDQQGNYRGKPERQSLRSRFHRQSLWPLRLPLLARVAEQSLRSEESLSARFAEESLWEGMED